MTVWLDAQISPQIAMWMKATFAIDVQPVRDLQLLFAEDNAIFMAARAANAVVITKDVDFTHLLDRLGPRPQVIWLTCGNTSNTRLREILSGALPDAQRLISDGEALVEITG